tara:strand:- start:732 stop:872 length:141 start_codon:yes stop_codon:yes gene_type:complete
MKIENYELSIIANKLARDVKRLCPDAPQMLRAIILQRLKSELKPTE